MTRPLATVAEPQGPVSAAAPLRAADEWGKGVVAPAPDERLGVRETPVSKSPLVTRSPLVWAVACHGGAGASTLAALLDHVGDSGCAWPGRADESPFVVLVARESSEGLAAADRALRQYRTGWVPASTQLVGLVLVAAGPRKPATAVRQRRELISSLAETVWPIGWHDYLLGTDRHQLPHADPREPDRKKWDPKLHVPPEVVSLGKAITTTVKDFLAQ